MAGFYTVKLKISRYSSLGKKSLSRGAVLSSPTEIAYYMVLDKHSTDEQY